MYNIEAVVIRSSVFVAGVYLVYTALHYLSVHGNDMCDERAGVGVGPLVFFLAALGLAAMVIAYFLPFGTSREGSDKERRDW